MVSLRSRQRWWVFPFSRWEDWGSTGEGACPGSLSPSCEKARIQTQIYLMPLFSFQKERLILSQKRMESFRIKRDQINMTNSMQRLIQISLWWKLHQREKCYKVRFVFNWQNWNVDSRLEEKAVSLLNLWWCWLCCECASGMSSSLGNTQQSMRREKATSLCGSQTVCDKCMCMYREKMPMRQNINDRWISWVYLLFCVFEISSE